MLALTDIDERRYVYCGPCYLRLAAEGMSPTVEEHERNRPLIPAWQEWTRARAARAKRAAQAPAAAPQPAVVQEQPVVVAGPEVVQEQARAEADAALLKERLEAMAMAIAANPRAFVGGRSRKPRRRWRRTNVCWLCKRPYLAWSTPAKRPTFCCGEHGSEYRKQLRQGIEHPHMDNAVLSPARIATTLEEFEAMELAAPHPPWSSANVQVDPEKEQWMRDNPGRQA